ncbi:MAG: 2-phosphosulfolactate phosphatase [Cyclobacteriaceae bacterium]
MKNIEICLSPDLVHLHDVKGKCVVVVDILRATSSMVSGIAHGVGSIIPVTSVEKCKELQATGCLAAGERGGEKVAGMDMGNSPFSYMEESLKGRNIAMTTTNGTVAIEKSSEADHILIGAFLNISAVAQKVKELNQDTLIFCAGWKGRVNAEDTLFAGNLIDLITDTHMYADDATRMAYTLYKGVEDSLKEYLMQCDHAKRLERLNIRKDISFCLKKDEYSIVPECIDGRIK